MMRHAVWVVLGLAACAAGDDISSRDGASAYVSYQHDSCEVVSAVGWLNDSSTTASSMKDAGVHSRAANAIAAIHAGADGVLGTSDDVTFAILDDVDAVRGVGPSALDQIVAYGERLCVGSGTPCRQTRLLEWLALPQTDVEVLKAAGVHSRAANSIVSWRDGAEGSEDDQVIDSLPTLDAISQVGPSALSALLDHGLDQCGQVVMSPQDYWESHLAQTAAWIDAADTSVDVAMYSFSDALILEALDNAVDRGVSVRALLEGASEDRKSPAGTRSATLEDMGIEVRWVNKIMHHKFALIDGPRSNLASAGTARLVTGSANWSYSAGTRYDENTLFFEDDARLALLFQREYNLLWDHGREVVWNEDLVSPVGIDISDKDIAAADGSDAVFTSANFKIRDSSTYGWTFSKVSGNHTAADALVDLIWSAEESIAVASGHMRSRQIAEAIAAKQQADPDVEIRVYLDAQEYKSWWTWASEVADYEECVEGATTAIQTQNCEDMGLHFGVWLHDVGVDQRFKYYAFRWDYHYAVQLHHKYVIVDERYVATGSYNFSNNAELDTFENLKILDGERYPTLIGDYVANFDAIYNTGAGNYESLLNEIEYGSSDVDLVFPSMALDWDQIDVLKDAIRDVCPDVDSEPYRTDPTNHMTCERG
jgi:phosphatidylserine/phosphatidylglycerophosphate/cardiolipin synthase-like enzyme